LSGGETVEASSGAALGVTAAGRLRSGVFWGLRSAREVTPAFGSLLNSEQKLTYTAVVSDSEV